MSKEKENKLSNYLPINRKIFDHPFWKEDRPYSKFEAWMYLIKSARFEDGEVTALIGGKLIKWVRSEHPVSLRFLGDEWNWSKNKVDDFLKLLEKEGMITKRTQEGTAQTIIKLCNYESYNSKGELKGQQKGQSRDTEGTGGGHRGDESKKEKKDNNEKEDCLAVDGKPPPPQQQTLSEKQEQMKQRQIKFVSDLLPYADLYSKEMIRAFFDYWKEPNKSKTKMKFEMEETWDLKLRLIRWEKNNYKFDKNGGTQSAANLFEGRKILS